MTTISSSSELRKLREQREAAGARIDRQTEKLREQFAQAEKAAQAQDSTIRNSVILRVFRAIGKALTDGFAST